MPQIQAPGVGSGLDINSIVNQLMVLERRPLDLLENKQGQAEAQLSAFGQLKSSISSFESAMRNLSSLSKFQIFAPTSSDDTIITASADDTAVEGTYDINVTALAASHKLASNAVTDPAAVVGEGTLTLSVGGNSFDVTIDSSNSSLFGIRDAVNNASTNTGVTATIVNENSGSRLIFTSDDAGTANSLLITASNGAVGNLSQLDGANLTEKRAAADAQLTIDTFPVTSSTNDVAGAIEGVTLRLEGIGASTVDVARDDDAIKTSVQDFADAFNELRDEIDKQREGQLEADGTLLALESQILRELNQGQSITGSNYKFLSEVGVSLDKEGRMQVDSEMLQTSLDTEFRSFVNLLAAPNEGFAFRLEGLASTVLLPDGLIDAREDGLNETIRRFDDQKANMEFRLEIIEKRIRAQFTAMDALVSNLNATSSFLSQQLSSVVGNSGSGNG